MRLHRIAAVEQADIGGQIFAEIRHPAVEPEIEHLAPNHAVGKPFRSGRVGEIYNTTIEFTKVDQRVVGSANALVAAVRSRAPGDKLTLPYIDPAGTDQTVQVTLGKAEQ